MPSMESTSPLKIFQTHTALTSWKDDLEWLVSVFCDVISEEILQSGAKDLRAVDRSRSAEIHAMFENIGRHTDSACLLMAVAEEKHIGYFLGVVRECLAEIPSRIGYVNGLYVLPSHRRQGIGQKLLDEGNRWFRSQGLPLVELYIASENKSALRFWEKNAYRPSEIVMITEL